LFTPLPYGRPVESKPKSKEFIVWWLYLVAVAAFAVVLVSSWVAWRQHGAPGSSRTTMIVLFAAGAALLVIGVWALTVTY
jgi:hypothetical protein